MASQIKILMTTENVFSVYENTGRLRITDFMFVFIE